MNQSASYRAVQGSLKALGESLFPASSSFRSCQQFLTPGHITASSASGVTLQPLSVTSPPHTLVTAFRDHREYPGLFNLITFAKTFFPNKAIFASPEELETNIWRVISQLTTDIKYILLKSWDSPLSVSSTINVCEIVSQMILTFLKFSNAFLVIAFNWYLVTTY